jgi:hypothetical protein
VIVVYQSEPSSWLCVEPLAVDPEVFEPQVYVLFLQFTCLVDEPGQLGALKTLVAVVRTKYFAARSVRAIAIASLSFSYSGYMSQKTWSCWGVRLLGSRLCGRSARNASETTSRPSYPALLFHDDHRIGRVVAIVAALTLAVTAHAGTADEIQHLLDYVGNSVCTFVRNGVEADATAARKHLVTKYAYEKSGVNSAEDFIRLVASRSSWTGEPYVVRCGNSQFLSADWLADELHRYREDRR